MADVDTILANCKQLSERYAARGYPLVAFECGDDVVSAIMKAVGPLIRSDSEAPQAMAARLFGIELRGSRSLRRDVCIPVYRMRSGEETWGSPIYLKAETSE